MLQTYVPFELPPKGIVECGNPRVPPDAALAGPKSLYCSNPFYFCALKSREVKVITSLVGNKLVKVDRCHSINLSDHELTCSGYPPPQLLKPLL
jgi:hypothetical protein